MVDDVKTLARKVVALEKQIKALDAERRLRFAEDRIKVLADSLTSSKDVEKLLDAYYKRMRNDPEFANKTMMREVELQDKRRQAAETELQKEIDRQEKQMDKMNRDFASDTRIKSIERRLGVLEAGLAALMKR